jgi:hypothetical protein
MIINKQERIDRIKNRIREEQSLLQYRINMLDNRHNILTGIESKLKEPYALIPIDCNSFEDWITGHPFPYSCICHVYENKFNAQNAQYVCNTYQIDYHIVKCESREFYKEKYIK